MMAVKQKKDYIEKINSTNRFKNIKNIVIVVVHLLDNEERNLKRFKYTNVNDIFLINYKNRFSYDLTN